MYRCNYLSQCIKQKHNHCNYKIKNINNIDIKNNKIFAAVAAIRITIKKTI